MNSAIYLMVGLLVQVAFYGGFNGANAAEAIIHVSLWPVFFFVHHVILGSVIGAMLLLTFCTAVSVTGPHAKGENRIVLPLPIRMLTVFRNWIKGFKIWAFVKKSVSSNIVSGLMFWNVYGLPHDLDSILSAPARFIYVPLFQVYDLHLLSLVGYIILYFILIFVENTVRSLLGLKPITVKKTASTAITVS